MMKQRCTTSVDQYVGARVRERRILIRMTQTELGERLNITFQQIQKYEEGVNRISAGRLYEIAEIMGVDFSYFFADAPKPSSATAETSEARELRKFATSKEARDVLAAYRAISSASLRGRLLALMRALSQGDGGGASLSVEKLAKEDTVLESAR